MALTDAELIKLIDDRIPGEISKFMLALPEDERNEILALPSKVFARIFQAGAVSAIGLLEEMRKK